jgi:CBS domain-containing protein
MIAKVDDTLIHDACIVDENTKLIDAIEQSMEFKTSTIIVKKKMANMELLQIHFKN